jgi:predicted nucleic acid-binding protein
MKTHVLDANALFRFLVNGPGAEQVNVLFKAATEARSPILMSVVNWGEVHYSLTRRMGISKTDAALQTTTLLPLSVINLGIEQARAAAMLKSSFGLPYADCFAASLAGRSGVVVTSDAKDFARVPWLSTVALPSPKPKSY